MESRKIRANGECNIINALRIAQITLRNRQNKNQRPRIILFIGSPITCNDAEIDAIGKQLKKNSIYISIIHFGTENIEEVPAAVLETTNTTVNDNNNNPQLQGLFNNKNKEKQQILQKALNNDSITPNLINVYTNATRFSDVVLSSVIGRDAGAIAYSTGYPTNSNTASTQVDSTNTYIDEPMEDDRDLAIAIQRSLEDTQQQQNEIETQSNAANENTDDEDDMIYDEDDPEIQAALALSLAIDQDDNNESESINTTMIDTATNKIVEEAKESEDVNDIAYKGDDVSNIERKSSDKKSIKNVDEANESTIQQGEDNTMHDAE